MPVRATKRGVERTPLDLDADVLVCGASFAGLAVARELTGSGARVLLVDRYEVGERQTSACAAPTAWLTNLGLGAAILQTFDAFVMHTPAGDSRWELPYTFSTFDYRALCDLLFAQTDARFEIAKVEERTAAGARTDRGELRAPLVVDALGWRRVLDPAGEVQPPEALMSRGLEVHPHASGSDLELWLDPSLVRAGYGWAFPAGGEMRVGIGSFEPRDHVREPTVRLAERVGVDAVRYQGNWIPHRLRRPADGRTFFVGDSAGHCFATTAEGIRPALYFGLACGRELRAVVEGRSTRERAMRRYGAFSAAHRHAFEALYRVQCLVSRVLGHPRLMHAWASTVVPRRSARFGFELYLRAAPPEFALTGPHGAAIPRPARRWGDEGAGSGHRTGDGLAVAAGPVSSPS